VPYRFPSIFPVNSVKALRGAFLALDAGAIAAYSHRVFRAYWVEDRDIAEDAVLAGIAAASGLDPDRLLAWVRSDPARERLRATTQEAIDRGAFGSPTFFLASPPGAGGPGSPENDDMYFGNDRLVLLEDALRRASLRDPRRPIHRLAPPDKKKEGPEGPSLPFLDAEI
jgi:2-hydroxychromene-2-carboxylate isomerase